MNNKTESNSPLSLFNDWRQDAQHAGEKLIDILSLATATPEGKPSVRIVLFKELSKGGVVFYTNYGSRKAEELELNPRAAIVIFWPSLERQIRIEGAVQKVERPESTSYFHVRPRGSQIGAWASRQSEVVPDREYLEKRFARFEKEFDGSEVPCPDYWGGYRLIPDVMEFWQGRENRLHDRTLFRKQEDAWLRQRLSP